MRMTKSYQRPSALTLIVIASRACGAATQGRQGLRLRPPYAAPKPARNDGSGQGKWPLVSGHSKDDGFFGAVPQFGCIGVFAVQVQVQVQVPEPASLPLMGLALAGLGLVTLRRRA